MNLFADAEEENRRRKQPLAARMRPRTLDEFVGQEHFLGPGRLLRRMVDANRVCSLLFTGPPGVGKTTLALLIAQQTQAEFVALNAIAAGVKEVRQILDAAQDRLAADGLQTVLFLDEIHRFSKSQQDVLLADVEAGSIVLIGATTSNPAFAVNAPLVSRSQVFRFESLTVTQISQLLRRAAADVDRGLGRLKITLTDEAVDHIATLCDGDARRALTALEVAALSFPVGADIIIDRAVAEESIQQKAVVYDATGDEHYDVASAFIKSMRGTDPDAAIYWLARMLEAGEDPRFIARRLVIFASEDVGLADPSALLVATAAAEAVDRVGLPEAQLNLAHATLHLATAPKSNSAMKALDAAKSDLASGRTLPVPLPMRDSHYPGAKSVGHGVGYRYPHDDPRGYVDQQHLTELRRYYHPTQHGREADIKRRLQQLHGPCAEDQPS